MVTATQWFLCIHLAVMHRCCRVTSSNFTWSLIYSKHLLMIFCPTLYEHDNTWHYLWPVHHILPDPLWLLTLLKALMENMTLGYEASLSSRKALVKSCRLIYKCVHFNLYLFCYYYYFWFRNCLSQCRSLCYLLIFNKKVWIFSVLWHFMFLILIFTDKCQKTDMNNCIYNEPLNLKLFWLSSSLHGHSHNSSATEKQQHSHMPFSKHTESPATVHIIYTALDLSRYLDDQDLIPYQLLT